jgi:transcriptional regulator with XRE-family HTH domain
MSREEASGLLGISTRTIDRYIKSGKMTYKKIANKVVLSQTEINRLRNEFSELRRNDAQEIVGNTSILDTSLSRKHAENESFSTDSLDEKINQFFFIFQEKEKQVEEKNKLIYTLHQKIWELDAQIKQMVALPDYTIEKEWYYVQKMELENKVKNLHKELKYEHVKNTLFAWAFLVVGVVLAYMILI